jgi:hypothetical protein
MKRIIITESQLKKVKKTLSLTEQGKTLRNEIGGENFSDVKTLSNPEQGKTLRPAIAKLKGENHIVIINKEGLIVGYGPSVGNMDKDRICSIAQSLIDEWEEEVNMNEIDQPDFGKIQPISFCKIK